MISLPVIDNEVDQSAVEELGVSRGWGIFLQRAKEMEKRLVEAALDSGDPVTRGQVKGIREVLALPEILLKEAREYAARKRKS